MFTSREMSTRSRVAVIAAIVALAVGGVAAAASLAGMNGGMGGMNGGMSGMSGMSGMNGAMSGMTMNVKDEFSYLTLMVPHHEEAIASAKVLLAGTTSARMKGFARTVIETQSAEVEQMKAWLAAWYPGRDTAVGYKPMMHDLTKLTGAKLDRAFLRDMIPHHMAAVMMSQQMVVGNLAEHDATVPFAEKIRDTQHAEIRMMARWLGGRGGMGMGAGMHCGMGR